MRTGPTSDLWWKNAVVYCLDVETFHDADGDGCGDFAGLIERVDHAARLGASCLWLMPFYPTPNRDDGYDITDYLAVDPRLGDLGDVVDAIRHARDRGLRVIVDLVVNHTSDRAPVVSRGARGSLVAVIATTTCGATTPRPRRARRRRSGPGTRRPGSTTCTASRPSSPT